MHARGKVIEIDDKAIRINRTFIGEIEAMVFTLDAVAANIAVNDFVNIAYIEKDGQLIAIKVTKVIQKKKK
jgi:hypothetical protein